MPLLKGSTREVIGENIRKLRGEGYAEDQAVAIAHKEARKKPRGAGPGTDDSLAADSLVDRVFKRKGKDVDLPDDRKKPSGAVKKTVEGVGQIKAGLRRLRGE